MGDDIYVKGKNKNDLLGDLKGTVPIDTASFEQIRMGIIVRCAEDLEKALEANANSSSKLSRQLIWLNVILTIVTIIGVFLAAMQIL